MMSAPLLWGLALAVATLAASLIARNRIVRRRLRFTLISIAALIALHLASTRLAGVGLAPGREASFEQLLIALALVNTLVTLLFNPWFEDRVPDRAPAIVQDTLVIAIFGAAAVYVLKDSTVLGASAIAAAAVGFALQDTLASAFAGLAIQIEKPFRVGHWVTLAGFEGIVSEVTWRATKLRTKAGNLVVIPNNTVAKEAITNYSEPGTASRFSVDVGAAYAVPPNVVRAAMLSAMRQVPRLLPAPAPDVLLHEFAASAIVYQARFWIDDFKAVHHTMDEVRRAIYYEFRRRGIDIPFPVQVQIERTEAPLNTSERKERYQRTIAATSFMSALDPATHQALAEAAEERMYADGEAIVREGEAGDSMFLVQDGKVAICIGPEHREVAVTEAGGYFGEMSLLTGDPRSATVTARGDCVVLEIRADAFRHYVTTHPEVIDRLAEAAVRRRQELDAASRAAQIRPAAESLTLARRIRQFFRLVH